MLLEDLVAYEERYLEAVSEALPEVQVLPDEDAGDRATIRNFFQRGAHIAHLRQALVEAGRHVPASDPLGTYRYALRLLWDRVTAAPQVPRERGAPWCLSEDERLLKALRHEEPLASVAESFGCSSLAVLGRAERLSIYGAFPRTRLAIWLSELAEAPTDGSS